MTQDFEILSSLAGQYWSISFLTSDIDFQSNTKDLIFFSTLGFSSVDFTPEMNNVTFCISGVKSTELKANVDKKIKPLLFYEKSILEDKNEI